MTRQGPHRKAIEHLVLALDKIDPPSLDDRQHGIGVGAVIDHRRGLSLQRGFPMCELGPADKIARVRKGWYPSPVLQSGIPAHVVGMQVRAEHEVDAFRRDPERAETGQVLRVLAFVPARLARARLGRAAMESNSPEARREAPPICSTWRKMAAGLARFISVRSTTTAMPQQ